MGFQKIRPFVSVLYDKIKLGNTAVASSKQSEPLWNETFFGISSPHVQEVQPVSHIQIDIRDYDDKLTTHDLGHIIVDPIRPTTPESWEPQWYTMDPKLGSGEVFLSAVLISMSEACNMVSVPYSEFPLRMNCGVRLYQVFLLDE